MAKVLLYHSVSYGCFFFLSTDLLTFFKGSNVSSFSIGKSIRSYDKKVITSGRILLFEVLILSSFLNIFLSLGSLLLFMLWSLIRIFPLLISICLKLSELFLNFLRLIEAIRLLFELDLLRVDESRSI